MSILAPFCPLFGLLSNLPDAGFSDDTFAESK